MADLVPYIYHEQQERNGSMLCAQHCLNNLLQQSMYSEVDLSDLARQLDAQENSTLDEDSQRKESQNMDDTGFFSLSVIENALQVWGLTLERWRGEDMRAEHDHPELQSGFILNLSSHWLPIRRFSTSNRWYNLNSFLKSPEWISPTGLAMVLEASESEGYSVFVLRSLDGGIGVLPECQAEMVALDLGEPQGRMGGSTGGMSGGTSTRKPEATRIASAGSSSAARRDPVDSAPTAPGPSDPVAASLARSRAQLEVFQRKQAAALQYGVGAGRARRRRQEDVPGTPDEDDDEQPLAPAPRDPAAVNRFQRQRVEEEEMMRQAILASLQEARERGDVADLHATGSDTMDLGSNQAEPSTPVKSQARRSGAHALPIAASASDAADEDEELDNNEATYDLLADQRHYDDEDAALQAALTASLADAEAAGLVLPAQQPLRRPSSSVPSAPAQGAINTAAATSQAGLGTTSAVKRTGRGADGDEDDEEEPVAEELTAEELRRRRLERFQ